MSRTEQFDKFKGLIPAPVAAHDMGAPLAEDGQLLRASYAIVYDLGADRAPRDDRYAARQTAASASIWRYVVRSVGTTPFAARAVDDAVAQGVTGRTIQIDGRLFEPVELAEIGEVQEDADSSPPLYYVESDYLLRSQPA